MSVGTAQGPSDASRINPHECGRLFSEKSSHEGAMAKRLVSSKQSRQQADWGWHVAIEYEMGLLSGSLINSNWILTTTFLTE
jgi:hypothetical protein